MYLRTMVGLFIKRVCFGAVYGSIFYDRNSLDRFTRISFIVEAPSILCFYYYNCLLMYFIDMEANITYQTYFLNIRLHLVFIHLHTFEMF